MIKENSMARRLRHCALYIPAFIIFYLAGVTTSHAAENSGILTDIEEYAVFAALLFPGEDIASTKKPGPDARPARLDSITAKYYRLSCFTVQGMIKTGKASDQEMTDDYNRKNSQVYQLDKEMLLPLIPEGGHVVLNDPDEIKSVKEGIVASSEITSISRPGFNKDKTRAIVQINHVAGPEMGVGYLVYMEKSVSTGTWMIVSFDLNRMY